LTSIAGASVGDKVDITIDSRAAGARLRALSPLGGPVALGRVPEKSRNGVVFCTSGSPVLGNVLKQCDRRERRRRPWFATGNPPGSR